MTATVFTSYGPRPCPSGCGEQLPHGRHPSDCLRCGDDARAVAYWTGHIDARNGRSPRVDLADVSLIGRLYTRGYTDQKAGVPW